MAKGKGSKKQARREEKLKRKRLTAQLIERLTPGFGRWVAEHMPKGTKWDDAARDGAMAKCVGDYLCSVFPSMDNERLHRIAKVNVRVKERRINVDMPGIARGILRAGGAIN